MYTLMERAGFSAFKHLSQTFGHAHRMTVVCGSGNNGGDGYVVARLALQQGWQVTVVTLPDAQPSTEDASSARDAYLAQGGQISVFDSSELPSADVLVDGLLGTGLKGDVRNEHRDLINAINASPMPVVSLDVPSGLNADTGMPLGCAVEALMTVTFIAAKGGLLTGQGRQYAGRVCVEALGVGEAFAKLAPKTDWVWRGLSDFAPLAARPQSAHKGVFGRLLCIGGNRGMAGAVRLSGEAALRCGAGLVKVHCHAGSVLQVANGRPELMVASEGLASALSWASCIVLGPGLGKDSWARDVFNQVLSFVIHADVPLLIDADGLNVLSEHLHKLKCTNLVMTPHPAEAARLLGTSTSAVESDRFAAVQGLAERYQGVSVLKGSGTLVSASDGIMICRDGNPGMATAGMGDVLSGVIGGLMAQGMRAGDAARYGVCLHAAAGDLAAESGGQRGMLASDMFNPLRVLLNQ